MINGEETLFLSMEMDGVLVWMTGRILGIRTRILRIVMAAIIGVVPTLWILASENLYAPPWGLVVVWPALILYVALSPMKSRRRWITAYGVFVGGTIAVGGLGLLFLTGPARLIPGVADFYWLTVALPTVIVVLTLLLPHLKQFHAITLGSLGDLRLFLDGRALTVHALWDSGNQARDPVLRRPVIIIETRALIEWVPTEVLTWVVNVTEGKLVAPPQAWQSRLGVLDFHSLGGFGKLPILAVDRVDAFKGGVHYRLVPVMVGFSAVPMTADGAYEALVNPACIAKRRDSHKEGVGA